MALKAHIMDMWESDLYSHTSFLKNFSFCICQYFAQFKGSDIRRGRLIWDSLSYSRVHLLSCHYADTIVRLENSVGSSIISYINFCTTSPLFLQSYVLLNDVLSLTLMPSPTNNTHKLSPLYIWSILRVNHTMWHSVQHACSVLISYCPTLLENQYGKWNVCTGAAL